MTSSRLRTSGQQSAPPRTEFVWRPRSKPQLDLIDCPFSEVFFGGARGGGKTDGVLGKWAKKERLYGSAFNAVMFRRTTVSSEDAIERSKEIYGPLGGRFNEAKLRWRMPNGGRVAFAYLDGMTDAEEYQGRNISDAWVEEAGQYPDPAPIDRLFGVLRSVSGVPVQLILTGNPGGAGQQWISKRYQLIPFPKGPKVVSRLLPNGAIHRAAVIPSRITDNRILLERDPGYLNRLQLVGSSALVRAWVEGDWSAVEGAFFGEWNNEQHVVAPFAIPDTWLRFRSGDWGSYSPFSIGWWAVVGDDLSISNPADAGVPEGHADPRFGRESLLGRGAKTLGGERSKVLPRGAIIRYREWYGKVGAKLTAEQVGSGIVEREKEDRGKLSYGVLDPSAFKEDGGPSIAERINDKLFEAKLAGFTPADNARVTRQTGDSKSGPMGGWDQMRARIIGSAKRLEDGTVNWSTGRPMIYCFSTCKDSIRTIPVLQHDPHRAEDLDTSSEDHAADDWRYGCVSRPWIKVIPAKDPDKRDAFRENKDDRMADHTATL